MTKPLIDIIATRFNEAKPTEVDVPEWGVKLYFMPLTPAERGDIRKGISDSDEEELMLALLIAKALDSEGNRVFDDSASTRATLMGKADINVVSRIVRAAGKAGAADAKNV